MSKTVINFLVGRRATCRLAPPVAVDCWHDHRAGRPGEVSPVPGAGLQDRHAGCVSAGPPRAAPSATTARDTSTAACRARFCA